MSENLDVVQSAKKSAKEKIKAVKKSAKEEIAAIKKDLAKELADKDAILAEKLIRKEERKRQREEYKAQMKVLPKRYTLGEEIFSSVVHGVASGLAIAALVLLLVKSILHVPSELKAISIVGCTIFGSSMIVVYIISTLYHALTPFGAKKVFAILNHSFLYVMIAGMYTPFCLIALRGTLGWVLFGIIWFLAILGTIFYGIYGSKMRYISAITYLIMLWIIIGFVKPLRQILPTVSFAFFIAGIIAYTIGALFYAMKKYKWTHCIWHLFSVMGSTCHFFAVYFMI